MKTQLDTTNHMMSVGPDCQVELNWACDATPAYSVYSVFVQISKDFQTRTGAIVVANGIVVVLLVMKKHLQASKPRTVCTQGVS